MAKLNAKELTKIRNAIQQFEFKALFKTLGWGINHLDNIGSSLFRGVAL